MGTPLKPAFQEILWLSTGGGEDTYKFPTLVAQSCQSLFDFAVFFFLLGKNAQLDRLYAVIPSVFMHAVSPISFLAVWPLLGPAEFL